MIHAEPEANSPGRVEEQPSLAVMRWRDKSKQAALLPYKDVVPINSIADDRDDADRGARKK